MVAIFLLMIVGGIGLAQAVSDPKQVTLRWLRLGGLISIALLAIALFIALRYANGDYRALTWKAILGVEFVSVSQLVTAQMGMRMWQRLSAALVFWFAAIASLFSLIMLMLAGEYKPDPTMYLGAIVLVVLAPSLLGGFLMTMLLGHAYLTAGGEMTQKPFMRLVVMLLLLLVLRAIGSAGCGLWPWWTGEPQRGMERVWTVTMISARYAVGLAVPLVMTWMTLDCVKRRANQSATGILYVTTVLVIVGEGIALALMSATGRVF